MKEAQAELDNETDLLRQAFGKQVKSKKTDLVCMNSASGKEEGSGAGISAGDSGDLVSAHSS
jgi:hypothetical protein